MILCFGLQNYCFFPKYAREKVFLYRMKRFLYITLSVLTVITTGCEGGSYSYNPSASVARLSAFAFAKNDSMPGLRAAVFSVEELNDTGLIWNKDSMLYGTRLDRVVPRLTFAATPSAAWITTPDTVCNLTGYDTLNFTKNPIYLTIRSSDKSNTKTYEIRATVHQQDPDLYTWTTLTEGIYPSDNDEQRAVMLGNSFILLKSNGTETYAYQSTDGAVWNDLGDVTGLPDDVRVRQIISDGERMYYGAEKMLYTSTNAIDWSATPVDYFIVSMLLYWNERTWALINNNGFQLAYYANGTLDTLALRPDNDFPVRDFATVCFESSSLRQRAMIIGGINTNGDECDGRWCMEYSSHPTNLNGTYRLQNFSEGRDNFAPVSGAAAVAYKNLLLLFRYSDIMTSTDEGLNWVKADSSKNRLPEIFRERQYQSAIKYNNNIYLFGGQKEQNVYSDGCKGRLNSIDWK